MTTKQDTPTLVSTETKRIGQELHANNTCATCHGELSPMKVGQVPLKNLADRYDQEALVALFKSPPSSMPPVTLEDEELNLLAEFLLAAK